MFGRVLYALCAVMSQHAPQPPGDTIFNRSGSSNVAVALWLATLCSAGRYRLQLICANVLDVSIDVSNVLQNFLSYWGLAGHNIPIQVLTCARIREI